MHKLNEKGSLLVPLIAVSMLFVFALAFGLWSFAGRQDYKNNVDAKIAEAVTAAEEKVAAEKKLEFEEAEKQPARTYSGPELAGNFTFSYPKTWSAYVEDKASGSTPLSGYMHPLVVPATDSTNNFALRFEVLDSPYDTVLRGLDSQAKAGRITSSAYRLPKVESVAGLRVKGEVAPKKQGEMFLVKVRDKTLKVWTEGDSYRADFQAVLDTLSFIP